MPDQVIENRMPDFLRILGCADDGDGTGIEEGIEHDTLSLVEKMQMVKVGFCGYFQVIRTGRYFSKNRNKRGAQRKNSPRRQRPFCYT
jgi:hypothetical protein